MQDSRIRTPGGNVRRLVLSAAFATGLAVALTPDSGSVRAADLPPARNIAETDVSTGKAAAPEAPSAPKALEAKGPDATVPGAVAPDAKADEEVADTSDAGSADARPKGDVSLDGHVIIEKGGKHIRIQGLGRDREYDSFQQFVQDAPWLAGLVFLTVLLVFLVPLLIIVLLIWYKMRKNRLANETMLKLAERGAIAPSAAMDAVASGTASSLAAAAVAASPAYEQARWLHRRTVWSDLRKGVILTGVGLGLTAFSILDDGTPNSIGLVFLFVGLGYCLLWFLEDRTQDSRRDTSGTPPAGGA